MTPLDLLASLRSLNIWVWAEGDKLRYSAPPGALTPDLRNELIRHKDEILALLQNLSASSRAGPPRIVPVPRKKDPASGDTAALPLSFSQERLWFLDRFADGEPAYNVPRAFRLRGSLDVCLLERSISEIIRRHEALRTTFSVVDGRPVQVIHSTLDFSLSLLDLRHLPEGERELEATNLLREAGGCPFDLSTGPLIRVQLLRLGQREHILYLQIDHIVCDAWSVNVFFQELATLYPAFSRAEPSPLPELTTQVADHAVWQRHWLQGEQLAAKLAYWQRQLANAPNLELPTDRPRPAVQTHRPASQWLHLPATLLSELRALGRREGATLFMTLVAALKLLLQRQAGQNDVLIGTPVAGRDQVEIEPLIGCFLNHLVLRTDLSGNPTFQDLVGRVRATTVTAFEYQDIPFEKLLHDLNPDRDPSRTPFFQVFFNMHDVENPAPALPGLTIEPYDFHDVQANFDLTVYYFPAGSRFPDPVLNFLYNADLFDDARMAEFAAQYEQLLHQIVDNPSRRLAQYSLVTAGAARCIPDPRQPLPRGWRGTIQDRVGWQARQNPEQIALVTRRERWTYAQLDRQRNRLAQYLLDHGIGRDDIVAIYAHRSAGLVAAILGVLTAGATFLILDPAYPAARLLDWLHLAQPRGWIEIDGAVTPPKAVSDYLAAAQPDCYLSLGAHNPLVDYPDRDPAVPIGPEHPACLVFTSGSMGKPKGVLGRHGPLTHFSPWQAEALGLDHTERFCLISGLAYDPLQREIFTALWLGSTLYIPDDDVLTKPGSLAAWMAEQGITFVHLTPAMGQLLAEESTADSCLPTLRIAFYMGDRLRPTDIASMRRLAPQITCINSYGSTETQRAVGIYFVSGDKEGDGSRAVYPLGRGVPGTQLLVLNREQQLAGVGELGEIYVRSPHLALGYFGDEALTQSRFLPNHFTDAEGDRMYRTGDLGRYLPDGNVEFAGRADRQVKVRGHRIEPAEVEQVLLENPTVRQAFVTVRDDTPGGRALTAYIVSQDQIPPSLASLRTHLQERLPSYMVPAALVALEALPLTPNGKVDRHALPPPEPLVRREAPGTIAPRNQAERQLARIWKDVLGIPSVGIDEDFFALGGHSLLAIRLFARIKQEMGLDLPVALLFQAPTVEQLAGMVHQEGAASHWASLVPIQPEGAKPPFFCVHGFGGGVLGYAELSHLLGAHQPFYGLQAVGLNGKESPHTSIEDMAAHYVEAMCSVQRNGPYNLGGYCYGGIVAYEMARQLQAQGRSVGLLAILEGYALSRSAGRRYLRRPHGLLRFLSNLPYWLRDTLQQPGASRRLLARLRTTVDWYPAAEIREWERGAAPMDFERIVGDAAGLPQNLHRMILAHLRAMNAYKPDVYGGRVTLFRVQALSLFRAHDPLMGWGRLAAGGVEVKMIPGAHYNILEQPHVEGLARALRESLDPG